MDIETILVAGVHTRPVVFSAKALGLTVYAVDYFGCVDLRQKADQLFTMTGEEPSKSNGRLSDRFDAAQLKALVDEAPAADAVVWRSGISPAALEDKGCLYGNSPEVVEKVEDKEWLFKKLRHKNIPTPKTIAVQSRKDALAAAEDLGYPLIMKPVRGAGGREIKKIFSPSDFPLEMGPYLLQERIAGVHASVSVLGDGENAVALTLNEQLLGLSELGQSKPYGYCGNIVPLSSKHSLVACNLAEKVTSMLGLVGSNGVDMVLTENGPVVIEVNPRFQGSMQCVEKTTNLNLVKAHIEACEGELPEKIDISGFGVRMSSFAEERSVVKCNLQEMDGIFDVPLPGVIIEGGEPIATAFAWNAHRETAVNRCKNLTKKIYSSLQPT